MIIWVIVLASRVLSHPTDEYRAIINDGEFIDKASVMQILPSGFAPPNNNYFIKPALADIVDKNKPSYKRMVELLNTGKTKLGLTFNIYDDKLREAAIAVYKLLLDVDDNKFDDIERWARVYINADMFDYATRLASLYGNKFKHIKIPPPFIKKPNYFVTGEAMWKAMHLKLSSGLMNEEEDLELNHYFKTDDVYSVNANYSGWNLLQNGCDQEINYFKEDVSLNSYYYGIHLLHPFWISNEQLDQLNPRHAEHFYFTHKQLLARYRLEKEHLGPLKAKECDIDVHGYNSYLIHDYGLPFPIKASKKGEWTDEKVKLKEIDIAITECISRGLIVDNGTAIPMGVDYNIDLVSKLIRANLDSPSSAKIIRSVYGYGGKGYPVDEYNPAPSTLHFPQTSLRDQTYWHLIKKIMNYFLGYRQLLGSLSLENYIDKDIIITNFNTTEISTYFDYYTLSLNKALGGGPRSSLIFAARQRRLRHMPFVLEFTVKSTIEKDVVVRLFLGPQCGVENCWNNDQFFELDVFKTHIKQGLNSVKWSTEESDRFSSDEYFNKETMAKRPYKYNLFKFPKNLAIPRGLKDGLNLTLFVMISSISDPIEENIAPESNHYSKVLNEVDDKPLGFPFYRKIVVKDWCTTNCRFYNVTIYHKSLPVDSSGTFSQNLY